MTCTSSLKTIIWSVNQINWTDKTNSGRQINIEFNSVLSGTTAFDTYPKGFKMPVNVCDCKFEVWPSTVFVNIVVARLRKYVCVKRSFFPLCFPADFALG